MLAHRTLVDHSTGAGASVAAEDAFAEAASAVEVAFVEAALVAGEAFAEPSVEVEVSPPVPAHTPDDMPRPSNPERRAHSHPMQYQMETDSSLFQLPALADRQEGICPTAGEQPAAAGEGAGSAYSASTFWAVAVVVEEEHRGSDSDSGAHQSLHIPPSPDLVTSPGPAQARPYDYPDDSTSAHSATPARTAKPRPPPTRPQGLLQYSAHGDA